MARSAGRDFSSKSIDSLIDRELAQNPELSDGISAYAGMFANYRKNRDGPRLLHKILDHAARAHRRAGRPNTELLTFNDGSVNFLFDATDERTVLVWAVSRTAAPNSRDDTYHNGFPRAGDGLDKGHAWSHAQGGREGGPNYFRQARRLNQSRSHNGKLWRAIETYLAANEGLTAFIRLIYASGNSSDRPNDVEYGLLSAAGQFRVVIFPNS